MAHILVVDDDQQVGDLLGRFLSPEHEVLKASDGKTALMILMNYSVDVVITDIYMPDIDGLELIRDITRTSPKTTVIAMSGQWGKFGNDLTGIARALGADYLLSKPFDQIAALHAVSAVLPLWSMAT